MILAKLLALYVALYTVPLYRIFKRARLNPMLGVLCAGPLAAVPFCLMFLGIVLAAYETGNPPLSVWMGLTPLIISSVASFILIAFVSHKLVKNAGFSSVWLWGWLLVAFIPWVSHATVWVFAFVRWPSVTGSSSP